MRAAALLPAFRPRGLQIRVQNYTINLIQHLPHASKAVSSPFIVKFEKSGITKSAYFPTVSGVLVVDSPSTKEPEALAAFSPFMESSATTHWQGSKPKYFAAVMKQSGEGFDSQ